MIRSRDEIRVWRFPLLGPILSIFILASEAHVSQSATFVALEDLIRMSESILLVRKDIPYSVTDTIPVDPSGNYPGFHTLRHRYLVLNVLKSESLDAKLVAKAAAARGGSNDADYWRYGFDRKEGEEDEDIIVFLSYDRQSKRYAYRVDSAMERKEAQGEIEAVLKPKRKFLFW